MNNKPFGGRERRSHGADLRFSSATATGPGNRSSWLQQQTIVIITVPAVIVITTYETAARHLRERPVQNDSFFFRFPRRRSSPSPARRAPAVHKKLLF